MYFNKYYSYKTKEYIHKTILSEYELKVFRKIIREDMPEVDYNKLLIRKFNLENEYKYINSPNSVGIDALKEIEKSGDRYYTVELTDSEFEELFEQNFRCMVRFKENYDIMKDTVDDVLDSLALNIEDV